MVHTFSLLGQNIAVDVNSGAVHILDDTAYAVVRGHGGQDHAPGRSLRRSFCRNTAAPRWKKAIRAAGSSLPAAIVRRRGLYRSRYGGHPERAHQGAVPARIPRLQSPLQILLCLHRRFRHRPPLMDADTAKAAIDFVIERSGARPTLKSISSAASR